MNYKELLNNPEEYYPGNKMKLDNRHVVTIKQITPGLMFTTIYVDDENDCWDVMSRRLKKI